MYIFEWRKEFSIGNEKIDKQHEYLFLLVNSLYQTMVDGKSTQIIGSTLEELIEYCDAHFRDEEKLFSATDYPDKDKHIQAHLDFTKTIMDFYEDYKRGNKAVRLDVIKMLSHWLMEHIIKMDKAVEPYLKTPASLNQMINK